MPYRIGTCSWNYESWKGLVYSEPQGNAAAYLPEYAARYRTAEIDSWFYRIPTRRDVEDYVAAVDPDFVFTCKAPQDITLTYTRGRNPAPNPAFLSPELFIAFHERIAFMKPQLGVIMLEFEYLNRQKMPGRDAFMERLSAFVREIPRDIPIAIECRNGPWLDAGWFAFLKREGLSMVFSEKQYMPRVTELYEANRGAIDALDGPTVIRLLGGDRAEMETATAGRWDRIVEPQSALPDIASLIRSMSGKGNQLYVNVNNHFEGCAPLTIGRLEGELAR